MSLAGAKLISLDEKGAHGEVIAAKGRKFTIGYYMTCDHILTDSNAKGLHCEIICDAFGRVTIHNLSKDHPVILNDKVITIKRPLLSGSKIHILGKSYLWDFPRATSNECEDINFGPLSTPQKQIGIPEQPPNSCPNLMLHRDIQRRFTVHNFVYCIQSDDEGNSSIDTSIIKDDIKTTETRDLLSKTCITKANDPVIVPTMEETGREENCVSPEPQHNPSQLINIIEESPIINLINCTQNKENKSSPEKKTHMSFCQLSDIVITSYSPRETGVRMEKSFTAILKPTTPRSVYSTPKSFLHDSNFEDDGSRDFIDFSTPATSKKSIKYHVTSNSSMYLIDLTTPGILKESTGAKSSNVKSVLKSTSKRNILPASSEKCASQDSVVNLPRTPDVEDLNAKSRETPDSVISISSSDTSSVIEVSDKSEVSLAQSTIQTVPAVSFNVTPKKSKITTPKRTPHQLMKRAILTSAKKQGITPIRPEQSSSGSGSASRASSTTSRMITFAPATTPKNIANKQFLMRRQSLSTPGQRAIAKNKLYGSPSSPNAAKTSSPNLNRSSLLSITGRTLPTSTPLRTGITASRTSIKTSPLLHKVRKSVGSAPLSSHISKIRRTLDLSNRSSLLETSSPSSQLQASTSGKFQRKTVFVPSPANARARLIAAASINKAKLNQSANEKKSLIPPLLSGSNDDKEKKTEKIELSMSVCEESDKKSCSVPINIEKTDDELEKSDELSRTFTLDDNVEVVKEAISSPEKEVMSEIEIIVEDKLVAPNLNVTFSPIKESSPEKAEGNQHSNNILEVINDATSFDRLNTTFSPGKPNVEKQTMVDSSEVKEDDSLRNDDLKNFVKNNGLSEDPEEVKTVDLKTTADSVESFNKDFEHVEEQVSDIDTDNAKSNSIHDILSQTPSDSDDLLSQIDDVLNKSDELKKNLVEATEVDQENAVSNSGLRVINKEGNIDGLPENSLQEAFISHENKITDPTTSDQLIENNNDLISALESETIENVQEGDHHHSVVEEDLREKTAENTSLENSNCSVAKTISQTIDANSVKTLSKKTQFGSEDIKDFSSNKSDMDITDKVFVNTLSKKSPLETWAMQEVSSENPDAVVPLTVSNQEVVSSSSSISPKRIMTEIKEKQIELTTTSDDNTNEDIKLTNIKDHKALRIEKLNDVNTENDKNKDIKKSNESITKPKTLETALLKDVDDYELETFRESVKKANFSQKKSNLCGNIEMRRTSMRQTERVEEEIFKDSDNEFPSTLSASKISKNANESIKDKQRTQSFSTPSRRASIAVTESINNIKSEIQNTFTPRRSARGASMPVTTSIDNLASEPKNTNRPRRCSRRVSMSLTETLENLTSDTGKTCRASESSKMGSMSATESIENFGLQSQDTFTPRRSARRASTSATESVNMLTPKRITKRRASISVDTELSAGATPKQKKTPFKKKGSILFEKTIDEDMCAIAEEIPTCSTVIQIEEKENIKSGEVTDAKEINDKRIQQLPLLTDSTIVLEESICEVLPTAELFENNPSRIDSPAVHTVEVKLLDSKASINEVYGNFEDQSICEVVNKTNKCDLTISEIALEKILPENRSAKIIVLSSADYGEEVEAVNEDLKPQSQLTEKNASNTLGKIPRSDAGQARFESEDNIIQLHEELHKTESDTRFEVNLDSKVDEYIEEQPCTSTKKVKLQTPKRLSTIRAHKTLATSTPFVEENAVTSTLSENTTRSIARSLIEGGLLPKLENLKPLAMEDNTSTDVSMDNIFRTPRAKNVMVLTSPRSVSLKPNVDSVELVHSTEFDLNSTNFENLDEMFKTPSGFDDYNDPADEKTKLKEENIEEVSAITMSPEEAFDSLIGQSSEIQTPVRKVYARKILANSTLLHKSPFSSSDVISDLPKTDIQEWVDSLENVEIEENCGIDDKTAGELEKDEDCHYSDPLAASKNQSAEYVAIVNDSASTDIPEHFNESYAKVDPLSCSAILSEESNEAPFHSLKGTNEHLNAAPNESDISGIDLLAQSDDSMLSEPLGLSDSNSNLDKTLEKGKKITMGNEDQILNEETSEDASKNFIDNPEVLKMRKCITPHYSKSLYKLVRRSLDGLEDLIVLGESANFESEKQKALMERLSKEGKFDGKLDKNKDGDDERSTLGAKIKEETSDDAQQNILDGLANDGNKILHQNELVLDEQSKQRDLTERNKMEEVSTELKQKETETNEETTVNNENLAHASASTSSIKPHINPLSSSDLNALSELTLKNESSVEVLDYPDIILMGDETNKEVISDEQIEIEEYKSTKNVVECMPQKTPKAHCDFGSNEDSGEGITSKIIVQDERSDENRLKEGSAVTKINECCPKEGIIIDMPKEVSEEGEKVEKGKLEGETNLEEVKTMTDEEPAFKIYAQNVQITGVEIENIENVEISPIASSKSEEKLFVDKQGQRLPLEGRIELLHEYDIEKEYTNEIACEDTLKETEYKEATEVEKGKVVKELESKQINTADESKIKVDAIKAGGQEAFQRINEDNFGAIEERYVSIASKSELIASKAVPETLPDPCSNDDERTQVKETASGTKSQEDDGLVNVIVVTATNAIIKESPSHTDEEVFRSTEDKDISHTAEAIVDSLKDLTMVISRNSCTESYEEIQTITKETNLNNAIEDEMTSVITETTFCKEGREKKDENTLQVDTVNDEMLNETIDAFVAVDRESVQRLQSSCSVEDTATKTLLITEIGENENSDKSEKEISCDIQLSKELEKCISFKIEDVSQSEKELMQQSISGIFSETANTDNVIGESNHTLQSDQVSKDETINQLDTIEEKEDISEVGIKSQNKSDEPFATESSITEAPFMQAYSLRTETAFESQVQSQAIKTAEELMVKVIIGGLVDGTAAETTSKPEDISSSIHEMASKENERFQEACAQLISPSLKLSVETEHSQRVIDPLAQLDSSQKIKADDINTSNNEELQEITGSIEMVECIETNEPIEKAESIEKAELIDCSLATVPPNELINVANERIKTTHGTSEPENSKRDSITSPIDSSKQCGFSSNPDELSLQNLSGEKSNNATEIESEHTMIESNEIVLCEKKSNKAAEMVTEAKDFLARSAEVDLHDSSVSAVDTISSSEIVKTIEKTSSNESSISTAGISSVIENVNYPSIKMDLVNDLANEKEAENDIPESVTHIQTSTKEPLPEKCETSNLDVANNSSKVSENKSYLNRQESCSSSEETKDVESSLTNALILGSSLTQDEEASGTKVNVDTFGFENKSIVEEPNLDESEAFREHENNFGVSKFKSENDVESDSSKKEEITKKSTRSRVAMRGKVTDLKTETSNNSKRDTVTRRRAIRKVPEVRNLLSQGDEAVDSCANSNTEDDKDVEESGGKQKDLIKNQIQRTRKRRNLKSESGKHSDDQSSSKNVVGGITEPDAVIDTKTTANPAIVHKASYEIIVEKGDNKEKVTEVPKRGTRGYKENPTISYSQENEVSQDASSMKSDADSLTAVYSQPSTQLTSDNLDHLKTSRGRTRKPTARAQQFLEEERAKAATPKRKQLLAMVGDSSTPTQTAARRGRKPSHIECDTEVPGSSPARKHQGKRKAKGKKETQALADQEVSSDDIAHTSSNEKMRKKSSEENVTKSEQIEEDDDDKPVSHFVYQVTPRKLPAHRAYKPAIDGETVVSSADFQEKAVKRTVRSRRGLATSKMYTDDDEAIKNIRSSKYLTPEQQTVTRLVRSKKPGQSSTYKSPSDVDDHCGESDVKTEDELKHLTTKQPSPSLQSRPHITRSKKATTMIKSKTESDCCTGDTEEVDEKNLKQLEEDDKPVSQLIASSKMLALSRRGRKASTVESQVIDSETPRQTRGSRNRKAATEEAITDNHIHSDVEQFLGEDGSINNENKEHPPTKRARVRKQDIKKTNVSKQEDDKNIDNFLVNTNMENVVQMAATQKQSVKRLARNRKITVDTAVSEQYLSDQEQASIEKSASDEPKSKLTHNPPNPKISSGNVRKEVTASEDSSSHTVSPLQKEVKRSGRTRAAGVTEPAFVGEEQSHSQLYHIESIDKPADDEKKKVPNRARRQVASKVKHYAESEDDEPPFKKSTNELLAEKQNMSAAVLTKHNSGRRGRTTPLNVLKEIAEDTDDRCENISDHEDDKSRSSRHRRGGRKLPTQKLEEITAPTQEQHLPTEMEEEEKANNDMLTNDESEKPSTSTAASRKRQIASSRRGKNEIPAESNDSPILKRSRRKAVSEEPIGDISKSSPTVAKSSSRNRKAVTFETSCPSKDDQPANEVPKRATRTTRKK